MIERHQDYLLTVPSVPVGGIQGVPLRLDSDAPFAARLIRSRNIEIGLPDEPLVGWNFKTTDDSFNSTQLRTDWIVPADNGFPAYPGRGSILSPEQVFPPSSIIYIDIGNPLNVPITNAQLLFRGSKLFRHQGAPTYPPRMSVFPSFYQVILQNVQPVQNVLNNILTIKNTADFMYRYGVCDAFATGQVVFATTPGVAASRLFGDDESVIQITAVTPGSAGNSIQIFMDIAGPFAANQPMSVTVSGTVITLNPQTDGSGHVVYNPPGQGTNAQVLAAFAASAPASALVTATLYGGPLTASGFGKIPNGGFLQGGSGGSVTQSGGGGIFPPPLLGAPAVQSPIANVYVQLKDESGKPFSNVPIHINDLFGQGFPYLPNNVNQATQDDAVLFTPGLLTPEIYIPRRTNFYFDVYRNDPGGVPVDLYFRFCGMGVYPE